MRVDSRPTPCDVTHCEFLGARVRPITFPQTLAPAIDTPRAVDEEPGTTAVAAAIAGRSRNRQRRQQATLDGVVASLFSLLAARDPAIAGHCRRVGRLASRFARELRLPPETQRMLDRAGQLHDLGKLGIPESILNKPDRLTAEEFRVVRQHAMLGHRALCAIPGFQSLLPAILHHHENWDGSGYPAGLAGERIPLPARVLRIVDSFDALTSERPYRPAMALDTAVEIIARESGTSFDPQLVAQFLGFIARARRSEVFPEIAIDVHPMPLDKQFLSVAAPASPGPMPS